MGTSIARVFPLAVAVLAAVSVLAFLAPSSDAAVYDGEFDLYGYRITMGLVEPDQVSTVEWDFGDGSEHETIALTADNPVGKVQHTYSAKGDYVVTATMRNQYTDSSGQLVNGESTLTYLYHILGYPTVTFDSKGGSSVTSIEGTASHYVPTKPADPEKAGCVFLGWFTDEACTQAFDWTSEVTKHITLYAGWQETVTTHTCTLRYDANGGTDAPADDTYVSESTDAHAFTVSSPVPSRDGYRFTGWSDTADATVAVYKAGDSVPVACDGTRTVYAVWQFVLKISSVPDGSATVGSQWTYQTASNADGCTLSVSGADWLSVSDGNVCGTPMKIGTYSLTVTVSKEGCVSAVQTFDVIVGSSAFDAPPSAASITAEARP